MLKVHETINSIAAASAILIAFYFGLEQRQDTKELRDQAKENILLRSTIQSGDYKPTISRTENDGILLRLKYNLIISNISTKDTAIVDAKSYYEVSHTKEFTDYMPTIDPNFKPINIAAYHSESISLDVFLPLDKKCLVQ